MYVIMNEWNTNGFNSIGVGDIALYLKVGYFIMIIYSCKYSIAEHQTLVLNKISRKSNPE